jgi:hypothetical protein
MRGVKGTVENFVKEKKTIVNIVILLGYAGIV